MKKVNTLIEKRENNLRDIFLNNMNKEYFKEVVSLLNIKQDKLYKHTSSL